MTVADSDRVIASTGMPWRMAPPGTRQAVADAFRHAAAHRAAAQCKAIGPLACIEDCPGLLSHLEQYVEGDVRIVTGGDGEQQPWWVLLAMDGSDGRMLDTEVWLYSSDQGLVASMQGIVKACLALGIAHAGFAGAVQARHVAALKQHLPTVRVGVHHGYRHMCGYIATHCVAVFLTGRASSPSHHPPGVCAIGPLHVVPSWSCSQQLTTTTLTVRPTRCAGTGCLASSRIWSADGRQCFQVDHQPVFWVQG